MARPRQVYEIKVSIEGSDPPVWRRLLISANVTLRQAHGVIAKAMGWDASDWYCFRQDGREFGQLPPGGEFYVEDDARCSLRHCLCVRGDLLEYRYRSWRGSLLLEAISPAQGKSPARRLAGAGVAVETKPTV